MVVDKYSNASMGSCFQKMMLMVWLDWLMDWKDNTNLN